jgi:hypothetical protein
MHGLDPSHLEVVRSFAFHSSCDIFFHYRFETVGYDTILSNNSPANRHTPSKVFIPELTCLNVTRNNKTGVIIDKFTCRRKSLFCFHKVGAIHKISADEIADGFKRLDRNQSDAMAFILDAELIYDVQYQNGKSRGINRQMTPPLLATSILDNFSNLLY